MADLDAYQWNDQTWMQRRREQPNWLDKPISVYEAHLGSWRKDERRYHGWKNYRDLAHEMVDYCNHMGYTR